MQNNTSYISIARAFMGALCIMIFLGGCKCFKTPEGVNISLSRVYADTINYLRQMERSGKHNKIAVDGSIEIINEIKMHWDKNVISLTSCIIINNRYYNKLTGERVVVLKKATSSRHVEDKTICWYVRVYESLNEVSLCKLVYKINQNDVSLIKATMYVP